MFRGALFATFCCQYQIVSSKETFLSDIGYNFRRGKIQLNQFQQNNQLQQVKVWPILTFVKKTLNLTKMLRGALFGTFCSQYQIVSSQETFLSNICHPFQRRHSSFEPIWTEELVIRSNSLVCTNNPQKTKNLSKKVREKLSGTFAGNTRSLKVKKLPSKVLRHSSFQPIHTEASVKRSKSLVNTKTPQKN